MLLGLAPLTAVHGQPNQVAVSRGIYCLLESICKCPIESDPNLHSKVLYPKNSQPWPMVGTAC